MSAPGERWNAMSVEDRARVIKTDRSMRRREWAPLAAAMSRSSWEEMTPNQRGAVEHLLRAVAR